MNIFVFGSNQAGKHGKGAALYAKQYYGAIYGKGEGIQGRSYGIPTKDYNIKTLPLEQIQKHIKTFLIFARNNPQMIFNVTRIACGLAKYTDNEIAPFFKHKTNNVILPESFNNVLDK